MMESFWRGSGTATALMIAGGLVREGDLILAAGCIVVAGYWVFRQWRVGRC